MSAFELLSIDVQHFMLPQASFSRQRSVTELAKKEPFFVFTSDNRDFSHLHHHQLTMFDLFSLAAHEN